jgi:hypothetical protein
MDGFYDTLSSELGHARGHVSSLSCVGPRHGSVVLVLVLLLQPRGTFALLLVVALVFPRGLIL